MTTPLMSAMVEAERTVVDDAATEAAAEDALAALGLDLSDLRDCLIACAGSGADPVSFLTGLVTGICYERALRDEVDEVKT